ncbi:MFS transporter [Aeromicrobium wangtongii]|uniref:MFS transporter n=1 Tax=Aeromicrobium wangtongii TaxID=2969247 RepID=A0ABY5M8M4_9ACTN|nr:MFS transporter [Aeromicrobium wangtongii]MCD9196982.1 MFS transporter [Aeromicrobium wangtongii]UUP14483.1 MFS transporter [Aeromicrobium wangtongii]
MVIFDRKFGALFWGKLLSTTGVWMHSVVAAIVVFDTTGSTLLVGLITVAQFSPQLLLTMLSGKWADRGNLRAQIVAGRVLSACGSVGLAIWIWWASPSGDALAASVIVSSVVVGVGFVIGGPAMQSIVPSLVRPSELALGVTLNSVPLTAGRIAGPIIGATMYRDGSPALVFLVAGLCHLLFAVAAATLPPTDRRLNGSDDDDSIKAALAYVWRDRKLCIQLVAVAAIGFGAEPSLTLAPGLARDVGLGAEFVGHLSAAFGVGAALALIVVSCWSTLRPSVAGLVGLSVTSISLLGAALTRDPVALLLCFVLGGAGFSSSLAGFTTLIHGRVHDRYRGRVMALWLLGFIGSRPIAAGIVGGLGEIAGVALAFAIVSVVVGGVALAAR